MMFRIPRFSPSILICIKLTDKYCESRWLRPLQSVWRIIAETKGITIWKATYRTRLSDGFDFETSEWVSMRVKMHLKYQNDMTLSRMKMKLNMKLSKVKSSKVQIDIWIFKRNEIWWKFYQKNPVIPGVKWINLVICRSKQMFKRKSFVLNSDTEAKFRLSFGLISNGTPRLSNDYAI